MWLELRYFDSRLRDPSKQKFTDVSEAVKTYIPIGSTIADAEALMLAMKCEPPLRMTAEEFQHLHHYRHPRCTSIVTANPDKSQSLDALINLPGHFFQGHFLMIQAQAAGADQRVTSIEATIDIRTLADL
jgi:hypothetical protein